MGMKVQKSKDDKTISRARHVVKCARIIITQSATNPDRSMYSSTGRSDLPEAQLNAGTSYSHVAKEN